MKNILFIAAGLSIVAAILVATFFYEQAEPGETTVVEPAPVSVQPENGEPEIEEPVIAPEDMTSVNVFFSNTQKDPNTEQCEQVYAVARTIEPTLAVAKEALDQLLAGVTDAEKAEGYSSSLNSQARVVSIAVESGVATVVFNESFQNGLAGACKVTAVRAQIEATLKQFASVKEVVIKVEGVADEEVLQP